MVQVEFFGLERLRKQFGIFSESLDGRTNAAIKETAEFGLDFAKTLVPFDEGFTSKAITLEFNSEQWIIISRPPADHPGFPLNVFLEQGDLNSLNWGIRKTPRSGTFHFMKKTARVIKDKAVPRVAKKINTLVSEIFS